MELPNKPGRREHMHDENDKLLATLTVADSTFHCYISTSRSLNTIDQFHADLRTKHPDAAHIPYAASIEDYSDKGEGSKDQIWDDGEPETAMVGRELLRVLNLYKRGLQRENTLKVHGSCHADRASGVVNAGSFHEEDDSNGNGSPVATAVIVVRFFQERLLGVTCGRLTALYGRVARLALHRQLNGLEIPYIEKYSFGKNHWKNVYGLGAGDTELILDVVPLIEEKDGKHLNADNVNFVKNLLSELKFEGMVGSKAEVLPRLQNLQADLSLVDGSSVIPIYRYPGNYSGTEWKTHPWSPTTLYIKTCVEMALQPLYHQHMNHAVSNYYRDGEDRIDHHSDKDLDLNKHGVIVSVSLGCMRVMELRDRRFPHDTSQIALPPGSMFVLGPYTNANFTHSILPVLDLNETNNESTHTDYHEGSSDHLGQIKSMIHGGGRISLTFRDARTFLDIKSQRLFGQGMVSSFEIPILVENGIITNESLSKAVKRVRDDSRKESKNSLIIATVMGFCVGCTSYSESKRTSFEAQYASNKSQIVCDVSKMVLSTVGSYFYLRYLKNHMRYKREQRDAREFFSKKSASGNKY